MGTYLNPSFVERRISRLTTIPEGWKAATNRTLYQLDLKMCQIKSLAFSFKWGADNDPVSHLSSLLESPGRILRLDLSLNELTALEHDGLAPFRNLRELDASLNKLTNFQGIEVLRHLYSLSVAHNSLRHVDGLQNMSSLVELDLSSNNIRDISFLPSLINLRVLNVSSNELETLDGVSSLPKLEDLNVQRNNLRHLISISSCLRLRILNASHNSIAGLEEVTGVLAKLRLLQVLCLFGNPVEKEGRYQSEILQLTNITTLDNISVRPLPKVSEEPQKMGTHRMVPRLPLNQVRKRVEHNRHTDNILRLKDAARQAFEERVKGARTAMEDNVEFLQMRIRSLQDEHRQFEHKMKQDLEICLRYMDTLTNTEAGQFDPRSSDFPAAVTDRQWDGYSRVSPMTGRRSRPDYSEVKDTDEVLKCAYNELAKDRGLDQV